MADTIAVLSLKGGTGKTTTVRTLADVLRQAGLSVLTVDLDPQGNLSDYFDIPFRPGVYSFHRAANVIGAMVGPLAFGVIAEATSWRVPFVVMAIPCLIFVLLAFKLKEPLRGHFLLLPDMPSLRAIFDAIRLP